MSRIKIIFAALCLGLTVLWLEADRVWLDASFAAVRTSFLNYTGIIAMGVMAVSLLLALRSTTMEPHLGGLDKSYRLHKWLGVAGLIMAIAHWCGSRFPRHAHPAEPAGRPDQRFFAHCRDQRAASGNGASGQPSC